MLCNLKANGIEEVIVADIVENRLEVVKQLGGIPVNSMTTDVAEFAIERFGSVTDMNGNATPDADIWFDSAGHPSAINGYVAHRKPGSRCVVLALSGNVVEIPQAAKAFETAVEHKDEAIKVVIDVHP